MKTLIDTGTKTGGADRFNGKEHDSEAKGWQNQIDYGMRVYDPRVGRFLSRDPLSNVYPHYTPYQFSGNKPIWAADLDGLEEQKETTVDISQYNVKHLFDTYKIQEQLADQIYQQLGRIPTRTEMEDYGGKKIPNKLVLSVISEHLIVDVDNGYATLLNPDTKEPSVFFKISKGVMNFATDETKPILIQLTGVSLYKAGELLEKVSQEIENYKKLFYKKYFPDKYKEALKANKKLVSAGSKVAKGLGKGLKVGAKGLNVWGTITLWYGILNPSPGPLSDDEIRENVLRELKRFIERANEQPKGTESKSE